MARSCENLNYYFPAQTELFYLLRSQCSVVSLNFFERLLDFSQTFKTNGQKTYVQNFLPDLKFRENYNIFFIKDFTL
jgi:hypothetical protein